MYDAFVQQNTHLGVRPDTSAHVHSSDVSGQSGYNAGIARSTGYEPNVGLDESGTHFTSIADGDDADQMGIETFSVRTRPTFPSCPLIGTERPGCS